MIFVFLLVMRRLMITKSSVVKIQNLVTNHLSWPVKSHPQQEICLETTYTCLLILDILPFRPQIKGKHSIDREFPSLAVCNLVTSMNGDRKIMQSVNMTTVTTVFNGMPYCRFIEIQEQRNLKRKKCYKKNQDSNFLGGSFSNRGNVRVPIQFRRKKQPQHLKRQFFLKNRPIHFHINNNSEIRLVKWKQLSFSSIEINKPFPAPVHSVS